MIDGKTKVCGLIGDPVEHTLSPQIHNTLASLLGHNLVYVPFLVDQGFVKEAVEGAAALRLAGLNVTVPHKSAVIPYLKQIDGLAKKIGAVNTLVPCEGGYKGYNTDMEGLYRALESEGIRMQGEEILLLGAGGAARAAAFLCADKGAAKVYLLNRSLEKARAVAAEVNRAFGRECIAPMALSDYDSLPRKRFLAIQGTSVGLYPNTEEAVITDPGFYQRIHTGFDLIYRPEETRFMRLVEKQGGKAVNGLKMLLYQGIIAYELWNNVAVSEEIAAQVYSLLRQSL